MRTRKNLQKTQDELEEVIKKDHVLNEEQKA